MDKFFLLAQYNGICVGVDFCYIYWFFKGNVQFFVLIDGVEGIVFMGINYVFCGIDKLFFIYMCFQFIDLVFEEVLVVVVGYKIDFIVFCFFG